MTQLTEIEITRLLDCIEYSWNYRDLPLRSYAVLDELVTKLQGMKPVLINGQPPWRTLDEDTQEQFAIDMIEQIRDCAKDYAHDALDSMSLDELAEMGVNSELDLDDDPTPEQLDAWLKEHVVEKDS